MSYNGSGTFQINSAGQPVVTGTTISSTAFNALTADLATGLSTALTKDGQTTPTANIPLGGYKITGLANATLSTDAMAYGQFTAFGTPGYTTTATAAGTTTLTVSSTQQQFFTGVTTQTVVLPVTSTLVLGQSFRIVNMSTGVVTVNSSGGNAVVAMVALAEVTVTCILTSGTTAASWDIQYTGKSAVTGTGSMVLATSPTLVTPVLGVATATSINKVAFTAPATGSTLTIADGKTLTVSNSGTLGGADGWTLAIAASKTLTVSNSLTLVGTDSTTMTFPSSSASIIGSNVTATLTAGYSATPYNAGTKSSGTYTPAASDGNLQYAVNGGAHTLAPPSTNCTMIVQYTNNGSAGAITTSGFTKVSGSFTTTNGDDFFAYITVTNGFSFVSIQALQ
jgi:hypothetical protein